MGLNYNERASYLMRSGGLYTKGYLYLGYEKRSTGEMLVENDSVYCEKSLYDGYHGEGLLHLAGDGLTVDGNLYLGYHDNALGKLHLHNGPLEVKHVAYVGSQGHGVFNHNDGNTKIGVAMFVDSSADLGGLTINEGKFNVGRVLAVGLKRSPSLRQTNGEITVGTLVQIGRLEPPAPSERKEAKRRASYLLSGAGRLETAILVIGAAGAGEMRQCGGTLTIVDSMHVNAEVQISEYHLDISGDVTVGNYQYVGGPEGDAVIRQTGGTNNTDILCILDNGTYVFTGGDLEAEHIAIFKEGKLEIDFNAISNFIVKGDKADLINQYITSGRIVDPTLDKRYLFEAVYDEEADHTTLRWTPKTLRMIPLIETFDRNGRRNTDDSIDVDTASIGPSTRWHNGVAWSSSVPTPKTTAIIEGGLTIKITDYGARCRNLLIGEKDGGRVEHEKGDLLCERMIVGHRAEGTYAQNGTTSKVTAPIEIVGWGRNGRYEHSAGTNETGLLLLGVYKDCEGYYGLSGEGELHVRNVLMLGVGGTGTFEQSGGTNTVDNDLFVKSGAYRLSKTGKLFVANRIRFKDGEFAMDGGECSAGVRLDIGPTFENGRRERRGPRAFDRPCRWDAGPAQRRHRRRDVHRRGRPLHDPRRHFSGEVADGQRPHIHRARREIRVRAGGLPGRISPGPHQAAQDHRLRRTYRRIRRAPLPDTRRLRAFGESHARTRKTTPPGYASAQDHATQIAPPKAGRKRLAESLERRQYRRIRCRDKDKGNQGQHHPQGHAVHQKWNDRSGPERAEHRRGRQTLHQYQQRRISDRRRLLGPTKPVHRQQTDRGTTRHQDKGHIRRVDRQNPNHIRGGRQIAAPTQAARRFCR